MFKNKGIIQKIRKSRTFRGTCVMLTLSLLFEIVQPTVSLALTEGPSQPEVQSFEPIGTTQMVDLFTGDFNYNIPLFNLPGPNGGYPVNLAYHAGASMDDEASWVGLGWNINVGSLVRSMRGLPDEFMSVPSNDNFENASWNHDYLEVQSDVKESWTLGVTGGLHPEVFGADVSGESALSLSASIYYNNYNGLGVSLDPSVAFANLNVDYSIGLSLDSENGLGVNGSLSLRQWTKMEGYENSLSISYNGAISASYTLTKHKDELLAGGVKKSSVQMGSGGISFARNNFSPSVRTRMNNYNTSFNFKNGISGLGMFVAGSLGLFYNTQDINGEDKNGRKHKVVGYASAGKFVDDKEYTRDFIRQADGQITKSNQFLPQVAYTYDTYNSTGQGLSGYFRTRRNDVGRSYDPHVRNESYGLSGSLDLSPTDHFGVGFSINYGYTSQGPWDDLNALQYDFLNPEPMGIEEVTYLQAHGEQTILHPDELDYMRGLNLPFVRLKPKSDDNLSGGKRRIDATTSSVPNNEYAQKRTPAVADRVVRNTLIHNLKNNEVSKLGEFDIRHFTQTSQVYGSPSTSLNRNVRESVSIGNHPAGYKVLNQEGSYYVYGLPCYNTKEVENLYSVGAVNNPNETEQVETQGGGSSYYKVAGTQKFINKTTKSPYAHSYLLSSVQGADYVDLTNDGPSDDDMGYWVKFNYLQAASKYQWRSPYNMDHYNQGQLWTAEDDKASYQYGEKEMWYLAQIETKTHIAVFVLSPRDDMKEAPGEFDQPTGTNRSGMKLDAIKVYDKKTLQANPTTAVPLQTVVFEYHDGTAELCKGAPNAEGGKLTLKSVYFLSNGSTRGQQNKYQFDYNTPGGNALGLDNPDYAQNSYDAWGMYKPRGSGKYEHHARFPYVNQFNQDWGSDTWEPAYGTNLENDATKTLTKDYQDALAAVWCLKKITLPSGGTIQIKYESDDYGYVQHKTANQMFKIKKLGDGSELSDNQVYRLGGSSNEYYDPLSHDDEKLRRIYFKLEYPIPTTTQIDEANQTVYKDYVEPLIVDENGDRNLYFKTKMKLVQNVYDYVSGYLPLERDYHPSENHYNVGVDVGGASGGFYTHGYVTVQAAKKKDNSRFGKYHPLALAGWTYLQTNAQMLLNNSLGGLDNDTGLGNNPSFNDMLNQVNALSSMVPAAMANFGAIRPYCQQQQMAMRINLDYSCIRLASPDKVKYGGGHRVKEISITDNWGDDTGTSSNTRTYGQRFEYTIEEKGKMISSGVAQYEPQLGGDENALKYPIYYVDKQNFVSRNNLFAEAPVNESLFPGPSVGYRRVTVKSINTDLQMRNAVAGPTPAEGRTGGVSVHEYFTAKEFPTMVSYSVLGEENSTKDVFNLPIPIPFIGSIKRNYYHGTQAYMIELNDMHGKPKSVETFELHNYKQSLNPITSSSYEYQYDVVSYQGETVKKLNNYVDVIANDGSHKPGAEKRLMGVETDLFTDQRESRTFNVSGGLNFNADIPFMPILSVWPTFNNHKSLFRTYVTNKVIHRTGILKKTKSRDLQTVNESEIMAYDEKSGLPMLTRMKNEFGDDFYNYNIPAYYAYDRMGHAYRNINYTFVTDVTFSHVPSGSENGTPYLEFDGTDHLNYLVRGDELLVLNAPNNPLDRYKKVYFLGWKYAGDTIKGILHAPFGNINTAGEDFKLKVIRSGRRNNFGTSAANYLTKGKLEDHIRNSGVVDLQNVDPSDNTIKTPQIKANKVLSATASIFRDDWSTSVQSDLSNDLVTENPFLTGNSGIWRPYKTYTYVGPRKTSGGMTHAGSSTDPELYNDGVFEDPIKMFSWELGNIEDYVSNWEWVNEVTRYSPDAYELENRNRLNIYSSALYGYDNSLSIGVAGNATYNEVGVADFETITGGSDFMRVLSQTNLNFDHNHSAATNTNLITVQFNFKKATVNGTKLVLTPSDNTTIPDNYFTEDLNAQVVGLSITSRKTSSVLGNTGLYFNGRIMSKGAGANLEIEPFLRKALSEKLIPDGANYHGVITFFIKRSHQAINNGQIVYTDEKAHTGKKSMRIRNNQTVTFDQPRLKFSPSGEDKRYVLSMWVSTSNENQRTYQPVSGHVVEIGKMVSGSFSSLSVSPTVTYGKIVEGWQKIDVEFRWTSAEGNAVPAIRLTAGANNLFVDDVRISPKTGGLAAYVYDPVKFRLSASLNVDNYATFFYYNEEGNLHLKKQETEKGIFTVTESRGHVSKNY